LRIRGFDGGLSDEESSLIRYAPYKAAVVSVASEDPWRWAWRWAGEAVGVLGAVGRKMAVAQNLVCSEAPTAWCGTLRAFQPKLKHLSQVKPESSDPLLDDKQRDKFHSSTAQLLHLCKRVRPDILTAVAFLTKRVTKPQEEDYNILLGVIQEIRATHDMGMVLEVRGTPTVTAYVDALYGVHPDMKSHTGCLVTLGGGPMYAKSGTQKLIQRALLRQNL
jgi:hypothetical protein